MQWRQAVIDTDMSNFTKKPMQVVEVTLGMAGVENESASQKMLRAVVRVSCVRCRGLDHGSEYPGRRWVEALTESTSQKKGSSMKTEGEQQGSWSWKRSTRCSISVDLRGRPNAIGHFTTFSTALILSLAERGLFNLV